jgi:hypothetical protein
MAPLRPERSPTRLQPRRGAGPPKPVYVPDLPKPKKAKKAKKANKAKKQGPDKTTSMKRGRLGKKDCVRHYSFDWLLGEGSNDPLRRLDRWIPDKGQRPQPVKQPPQVPKDIWVAYCALDDWMFDWTGGRPDARGTRPQPAEKPDGVLISLWLSYCNLDDYVYRQWLTPAELLSLPLADDVDDYNSGLRKEQPVTPPGFMWVGKNLVRTDERTTAALKKGGKEKHLSCHVEGDGHGMTVREDFILDEYDEDDEFD